MLRKRNQNLRKSNFMINILLYTVLIFFIIFTGCDTKKTEKKPPAKQPAAKVEAPKAEMPAEVPKKPVEGYTYVSRGRRDPFKSLIILEAEKVGKRIEELPPLQRIDSADLKLTGIIWDKAGYIAMVETPDGKGFVVKEGTIVGLNKGIVKKITSRSLTIEEKIKTYVGETKTREVTIELRKREEGQ